mmetsp:Transcript_663/g.1783  ORF Transcript_663/g.1783 Transcript_663/m.1783 type:complete len:83 (-) Transcript_663:693-941(-)
MFTMDANTFFIVSQGLQADTQNFEFGCTACNGVPWIRPVKGSKARPAGRDGDTAKTSPDITIPTGGHISTRSPTRAQMEVGR